MKKAVTKKEFNDYKKEDKKQDKAMMDNAMKKDKVSDNKTAVKKRVKTDSSY